jgi:hypothetical protein
MGKEKRIVIRQEGGIKAVVSTWNNHNDHLDVLLRGHQVLELLQGTMRAR